MPGLCQAIDLKATIRSETPEGKILCQGAGEWCRSETGSVAGSFRQVVTQPDVSIFVRLSIFSDTLRFVFRVRFL